MNSLNVLSVGSAVRSVLAGEKLDRMGAAKLLRSILALPAQEAAPNWTALFAAIQSRTPTKQEISGFVDAVQDYEPYLKFQNCEKIRLSASRPIVSISGSGKDSWKTYNISTAAAIVAAAAGACVIKPCSTATSSTSGSTDVLMHLGISIGKDAAAWQSGIERFSISFLSYSSVALEYGKRYDNLFQFFHPLSYVLPPIVNPIAVDACVYGIADSNVELASSLLSDYGLERHIVVASQNALAQWTDELVPGATSIKTAVSGLPSLGSDIGFLKSAPGDVERGLEHGHCHSDNASALCKALAGEAESGISAIASMAAGILVSANCYADWDAAYAGALRTIEDGAATRLLTEMRRAGATPPVTKGSSTNKSVDEQLVQIAAEARRAFDVIQEKNNYASISSTAQIGHLDSSYLTAKFQCEQGLALWADCPVGEKALITGFGPTAAPTAATLSVMMKVLALQKELGVATEIIISDLGAYLSRNLSWLELETTRNQFVEFVQQLSLGFPGVRVRTHIDRDGLGIASLLREKALTIEDVLANEEETTELYATMGLLGPELGIVLDAAYTVADIVKPLFKKKFIETGVSDRTHVLVVCGLEEHYFVKLANLALKRLKEKWPGRYVSDQATVSALYTKLIPGLAPYPKMSKSIPLSGIGLADSKDRLIDAIMACSPENEAVIFEMINQTTTLSMSELERVSQAFEHRRQTSAGWQEAKRSFLSSFSELADIWQRRRVTAEQG